MEFSDKRLRCISYFSEEICDLESPLTILHILTDIIEEHDMLNELETLSAPYDNMDEVAKEIAKYYLTL